ncbi:MAG: hypothetical protein ROW48_04755 [Bellilinea sp.]|jgi:hypothetical protein
MSYDSQTSLLMRRYSLVHREWVIELDIYNRIGKDFNQWLEWLSATGGYGNCPMHIYERMLLNERDPAR